MPPDLYCHHSVCRHDADTVAQNHVYLNTQKIEQMNQRIIPRSVLSDRNPTLWYFYFVSKTNS